MSNPAGVVEQACQLVLPRNYGVNPYEPGTQEVATTLTRMFGDTYSMTSPKIHKLYAVAIIQILGVDLVGKWLRDIHNITVPLSDPSFLQSMQQRGRENCRKREYESRRLRHQANSEELAVLEKLLADREVLDDVQLARLEELRSARERVRERQNESNRLNSAELAALEQLEADEEVLDDVQLARLEELRRAKKRHNEAALSSYHAKRQKREEAAPVESHPMIKLLVN